MTHTRGWGYSGLLIAFALVLGPRESPALWPWGKSSAKKEEAAPAKNATATRRFHLSIPDKNTEKELLGYFSAKRWLDEDVRVLKRLTDERKKRFLSLQDDMRKEFLIVPEAKYEYDDKDRTIYRIDEPAGASATNAVNVEVASPAKAEAAKKRILHKKLGGENEERRFGLLMAARRTTLEEVRVLVSLSREQQQSLDKVNDLLAKKFAMKEGRYYDYDRKDMKVYEITPLPRRPAPVSPDADVVE